MEETKIYPDSPVLSLVKQFYDVIDAQQWEIQESFVSNDFVAVLGSSLRVSFKDWQEKLKGFYSGFPEGRHVLEFFLVEGDRILSVGRFTGAHQKEFMGELPTGNQIEMGVMHLDRVVDNRIVEHTASADLLGLLQQMKANR